jgi:hypothetical protein
MLATLNNTVLLLMAMLAVSIVAAQMRLFAAYPEQTFSFCSTDLKTEKSWIRWLTGGFLVATTLNFTLRETAEVAVHFKGLVPMVRLSGISVHGCTQISRGGHGRVRSRLYLATLSEARFNPIIKPYYDRLRAVGKPMKVARCACAPSSCISPLP